MKPTTLLPTSLLLLIHSLPATAYISLNDTRPYWSYTTQHLSPTTSQKCQTAYSAPIDCPETLLALATSLRPDFQPTQKNLSSMCTPGCKSALEDYVQNVGSRCGANGDLAPQQDYTTGQNKSYVRVWVVGQVLEYAYAQSCAKDQTNHFCPLPPTPPNCTSPCSTAFYTTFHTFRPASHKLFRHSYLTSQPLSWIQHLAAGYKTLVACGAANQRMPSTTGAGSATAVVGGTGSVLASASATATAGISGEGAGLASATKGGGNAVSAGSVVDGYFEIGVGVVGWGLVAAACFLF